MSINEDQRDPISSDNMDEVKVNVEETSVNLSGVKKELDEEKQYKIAYSFENIFGESSIELGNNRDNLIGFIDDDVIMEAGNFKLDVKEENEDLIQKNIEQFHCNRCSGNYEGYCPNCSSLSHILNNLTPNLNPEPVLNSTPTNMFEIREVSNEQAVFALKTFPKGIILGPFEGVTPIESTTGLQWKIKDKKFVNDQSGNWMKYIQSVRNHASKNLDVFQINGILYFETSREIQEGEELLVNYGIEDKVLNSDKEKEFYLVPVKKEGYPKVFACTLCCLGFRLESCLVEHKRKCPQENHGGSIEDLGITQCRCCKVWLQKREHREDHMLNCLQNYNRLHHNHNSPKFPSTNTDEDGKVHEDDELATLINPHGSYSTATEIIESNNRFYRIDCEVPKEEYFYDENVESTHSNISEEEYKSFEDSYQTNYKSNLKGHINKHGHVKDFQCDICKKKFTQNGNLKLHIENKHSNTSDNKYKCVECPYQTNYKCNLTLHLGTHNDVKRFQCDICEQRFGQKGNLKLHIKNEHSNTNEKEYKCSECLYQTNRKGNLKIHLSTHSDINHFQCDICKKKFTQKSNLKLHIKNIHSNSNEKEYKCSECSYQTNCKRNLKSHLNTHNDIKPVECDICKRKFSKKSNLKIHMRYKHKIHPE